MSYSAYLIADYDVRLEYVNKVLDLIKGLENNNTNKPAYNKTYNHFRGEIYDKTLLQNADHIYIILNSKLDFKANIKLLTSLGLNKQIFIVYPKSTTSFHFYSVNVDEDKFISGIPGTSFKHTIPSSFFINKKGPKLSRSKSETKKYRRLLLLPIR